MKFLAQSLTLGVVYSFPRARHWRRQHRMGRRSRCLPTPQAKAPRKPHPSTSRLLSSALPRPHHCHSHIWASSAQGPQWRVSVAVVAGFR